MTAVPLGPVVAEPSTRRDRVMVVLLSLAVVGALLSIFLPAGCGGCERAKRAAGALPLAELGLVFYIGLLLTTLRWGTTRMVQRAIVLAAGVHVMLFSILIWRQAMCWVCLGTGLSVLGAATYLLTRHTFTFRFAAVWVLNGSVVIGGPLAGYMRYSSHAGERQAIAAAQEILRSVSVPEAGQVEMILLTRQGCPRCETFRKTILPALLSNPAVRIDVRTAGDDVPTPTVLVHGKRAYTAIGLRPLADYQRMLSAAAAPAGAAPDGVVLLDVIP